MSEFDHMNFDNFSLEIAAQFSAGVLKIQVLDVDPNDWEDVGLVPALREKYGTRVLCLELPEKNDSDLNRTGMRRIYEALTVAPDATKQLFMRRPLEFSQPSIYLYGQEDSVIAGLKEIDLPIALKIKGDRLLDPATPSGDMARSRLCSPTTEETLSGGGS